MIRLAIVHNKSVGLLCLKLLFFLNDVISDKIAVNPCIPNPCGQNSECFERNNQAICSCLLGYIGAPPSCRPECLFNSECSQQMACFNKNCVDPCIGVCGEGSECRVVNHNPVCMCQEGYIGNPLIQCTLRRHIEENIDRCNPSPCGPNSQCSIVNDRVKCSCFVGFEGNPPSCHPECSVSVDCPSNKICQNMKCVNPCPGSCGLNAICSVSSHVMSCICEPGFNGNPYSHCEIRRTEIQTITPCYPNPCGINADCSYQNNAVKCTCLPEYFGNPYSECKPECVADSDCVPSRACRNQRCVDPCPGVCGASATCSVLNHRPICSCIEGYEGNAYSQCRRKILVDSKFIGLYTLLK